MLTSWSWLSLKFLHRYGMALVLVCAATVCRFIFLAKLGDQAPFVTFFPAMIFAALYGGLGPGLMATFLSAVLADYLLLEPQGILQLRDSSNIASLAFFLVSGSMISVLVNTMQRARERSRQAEIQASLADQRLQVAQAAQHHAEVTDGINRILNAAIANHSERELGHICLDVAEKVTQSRCGFIGEISAAGKMDTIAISDPGWDVCRVKDAMGHDKNAPRNHPLRGLYGEVLLEGKAFLTNDPVNHPSSIGTPPGHPEIHSFLGVPLIHNDKTIGLVAMANREGGYNQEQLEDLKTLAGIIVQAFMHHRTESALAQSEQRLALALNVGGGAWDWKSGSDVPWWSPELYELWGVKPGTPMTLEKSLENIHPDDHDIFRRQSALGIDKVTEVINEFRLNHPVHGLRWLKSHGRTLCDANGRVTRITGIIQDITGRKQAEEALQLSEEKFAKAFDDNPAAIVLIRLDNEEILDVNNTWLTLCGYRREEIIGQLFPNLQMWPVGSSRREDCLRELHEKGSITGWEQAFHKKNGDVFISQLSAQVLNVRGDKVILSTVLDITDRKQAEAMLENRVEEVGRLNRTLKALSDSRLAFNRINDEHLYLTEVCRIIVEYCGHAMAWVSLARDDAEKSVHPIACSGIDRNRLDNLPVFWADAPLGQGPTGTAIRTKEVCIYRHIQSHPKYAPWRDRAIRGNYHSAIAFPLMRNDHAFGALTIHSRKDDAFSPSEVELLSELANDLAHGFDIFRLRQAKAVADDELRHAKEVAEEANKAKDHFLAVLSHELRTPMTPVLATAAMLQRDAEFPKRYREDIQSIERNIQLEARLIDDLLDVTRIARGKIELDRKPVLLREIVSHAVEVCDAEIHAKHLTFGIDLGNTATCLVFADAARLQQVFWNLLKNAIKFTPRGGCVSIYANCDGDWIVVDVTDTGVGIEPQKIPKLFHAFEQGSADITRQFGGLGLGLAITKGLVEMHGGSIVVESPGKNRGSSFRVRLPISESHSALPPAARVPSKPIRAFHILLVEDNSDTLRVMRRLLISDGHDVVTAGDAITALDALAVAPFDLLISDLGLPDSSGFDLMREVRRRGLKLPGIALSGYGQEEDIRRSREAGFVIHLTKPTSIERLTEAINSIS